MSARVGGRGEETRGSLLIIRGGGAGTLGCARVVWFCSALSVLIRQSGESLPRAFGVGGREGSKHLSVSPLLKDLH